MVTSSSGYQFSLNSMNACGHIWTETHVLSRRKEGRFHVRNPWWETTKEHGPGGCIGNHKLAGGWQKVEWKYLPGRENALRKYQSVASERGNFCLAVGRGGHSFKLLKGPTKSLVYSELGRSWLGLWHLSPSSPLKLTWRLPVSSVRLMVAWGGHFEATVTGADHRGFVFGAALWHLELKHSEAERGCH